MALVCQTDSRIDSTPDRTWLSYSCGEDVTDWNKDNVFVLATFALSNLKNDDGDFKLQWRRKDGTWYDVGADTEIRWGTAGEFSGWTDDAGILAAESATGVEAEDCNLSWDSGSENFGNNTCYLINIDDGDYGEIHWGLGFGSGALSNQEYEFKLICTNHSNEAVCSVSITTTAGAEQTLTIQDPVLGLASAPSVTKDSSLSIKNSAHGFASAPTLTKNVNLSVQNSTLDFPSGVQVLSQRVLTVQNSSVDFPSGAQILTDRVLEVQNSTLDFPSGAQALANRLLSVNSISLGFSSENVEFLGSVELEVQNGSHGFAGDVPDLTPEEVYWTDTEDGIEFVDDEVDWVPQHVILEVQDAVHGLNSENLYLLYGSERLAIPQPILHGLASTKPNLLRTANLEVQDVSIGLSSVTPEIDNSIILEIQDGSFGLSAETPSIDRDVTISTKDSMLGLCSDKPNVSMSIILDVQNSAHGFEGDVPDMTPDEVYWADTEGGIDFVDDEVDWTPQAVIIYPNSVSHGLNSENLYLLYGAEQLTIPQPILHGNIAEKVILSKDAMLSVQSPQHGNLADTPSLVINKTLEVANGSHGLASQVVDEIVDRGLSIQDSSLGLLAQKPTLNFNAYLTVQDASHKLCSKEVYLTKNTERLLEVQDSKLGLNSQEVTINYGAYLRAKNAAQGLNSSVAEAYRTRPLTIQSGQHGLSAETVDLTPSRALAVQDPSVGLASETPELIRGKILTVQDSTHGNKAEVATLSKDNYLQVQDTVQHHYVEPARLTQGNRLSVFNSGLVQSAEVCSLNYDAYLQVQNSKLDHVSEQVPVEDYWTVRPLKTFVAVDDEYLFGASSTSYTFTAKDLTQRYKRAA